MTVHLTRRAEKDLTQLHKIAQQHAITALQKLMTEPHAGHLLVGSLRDVRSLKFSAQGGAYRAAYVIHDDKCLVFLVGPHEGFYALAARRYRALIAAR